MQFQRQIKIHKGDDTRFIDSSIPFMVSLANESNEILRNIVMVHKHTSNQIQQQKLNN